MRENKTIIFPVNSAQSTRSWLMRGDRNYIRGMHQCLGILFKRWSKLHFLSLSYEPMPAPGREESLRECKVLIVLQTVGSMRSLPICIAGNNFFPLRQRSNEHACPMVTMVTSWKWWNPETRMCERNQLLIKDKISWQADEGESIDRI